MVAVRLSADQRWPTASQTHSAACRVSGHVSEGRCWWVLRPRTQVLLAPRSHTHAVAAAGASASRASPSIIMTCHPWNGPDAPGRGRAGTVRRRSSHCTTAQASGSGTVIGVVAAAIYSRLPSFVWTICMHHRDAMQPCTALRSQCKKERVHGCPRPRRLRREI